MQRLNPVIDNEGQPFVDEPVYVTVSHARQLALAINGMFQHWWITWLRPTPLANVLCAAFPGGQSLPRLPVEHAPPNPRVETRIEEFSHHERVQLRWMKPDGRGGLVPRDH